MDEMKDFDVRTGEVLHPPLEQKLRRVVLESPFSAPTDLGILENIGYARKCIRDCLLHGDAPIASHLLYTQSGILDDQIPEERELGMAAGWAWTGAAVAVVVYVDRGISPGMWSGIERAERFGIPVEYRELGIEDTLTEVELEDAEHWSA